MMVRMAKKVKLAGRSQATSDVMTAAQRENRERWAARHPRKAAQERAFRKQRALMVEEVGHKITGTIETHFHARRTRQGAVARLYASGRLSISELAWAEEIRTVVERIGRDVTVSTASLETRVDTSRHGDAFWEALGAVRAEVAYGQWRREMGGRAALPLDVIVEDLALTVAARRHHMSVARAGALLEESLQRWGRNIRDACLAVRERDLEHVHARLMQ